MHCPPPKPHNPSISTSASNPLPTHSTPLSTPLSSVSHLPRAIALRSALTLFVAIPDPHDHQSPSIPTCWNSLNSTLPYPSHHPIRPSCPAADTQAFSGLAIAPIHTYPTRPDQNQTRPFKIPSRQPPNIEHPAQLSFSSARGPHRRITDSPSQLHSLVVTSGEHYHSGL